MSAHAAGSLSLPPTSPRARRLVATLAAAAVGWMPAGADTDQFALYSDEQMLLLQHQLASTYMGSSALDDPVVTEYLRVLAAELNPEGRIHVTCSRDTVPNATANWGNVIIFHAGMIDFVPDEEAFAGVLAHELAHVKLSHFTRLAENKGVLDGIAAGTLLAGILSGSDDLTQVGIGLSGLELSNEFNVRRRFEREADRQAIHYLADAEFDPDSFAALISRLTHDDSIPEYASTHPVGSDRVAGINTMIRAHPAPPANRAARLDFWLVQERIRDRVSSSARTNAPVGLRDVVDAYRRLLAHDATGLATLREHRDHWIVGLGLADHALRTGGAAAAIAALADALAANPDNLPVQRRNLELLVLAQDYADARFALTAMPPDLRDSLAIAQVETRLWQALGDDLNYRVAVAYSHYYAGLVAEARLVLDDAGELAGAQAESVVAGRLSVLAGKLDQLDKLS